MHKLRMAVAISVLTPLTLLAQTITVSGTVIRGDRGGPLGGATVALSGVPDVVAGPDGRFQIRGLLPGRYALLSRAVGYQPKVLDIVLRADTTLEIVLDALPVSLDTVRTTTRTVTITGQVRDAASHTRILYADAILLSTGQTFEALSGRFKISNVQAGPVTLVVEAFEHLPARVELQVTTDTTIEVELMVDSVALRMTEQQARRLAERANGVAIAQQTLTGDDLRHSGAMTVFDYINRHLPLRRASHPSIEPADATCIFYDDVKVPEAVLLGVPEETVKRIEIYGSKGQMIRVYSERYVASLARSTNLARIVYLPIGLQTVCQ